MSGAVYLPLDAFGGGGSPDLDLAADYLELKAAFSEVGQSFSGDIIDALELGANEQPEDVNAEIEGREEVATGAIARMESRKRVLGEAYPFEIDRRGDVVYFRAHEPDLGQAAYLVSLLLSNLRAQTPLLSDSQFHPSRSEEDQLRQYFQYFATAAIAAEIGGPAWSFGFPRPDKTGFIPKLSEIWAILKDGTVERDLSAPQNAKDDKVDVFAWRQQGDGLPGFLLVAAQVATGSDWRDKTLKGHINDTFQRRWFSRQPVTVMVAYHVIPFARPDRVFRDDVLKLGNVLHRLRVPRRVGQAVGLVQGGVMIEAFELLDGAKDWIRSYLERARLE